MHFKLIKPVLSDYLHYMTLFQCSLAESLKTGLTVFILTLRVLSNTANLFLATQTAFKPTGLFPSGAVKTIQLCQLLHLLFFFLGNYNYLLHVKYTAMCLK